MGYGTGCPYKGLLSVIRVNRKIQGLAFRHDLRVRYFAQTCRRSALPHKEDKIDPVNIRNIGIIAHIDAGKTTTTERILYYSGITKKIGDVDKGNTVTDFLEAERERGITIQSAAITFPWRKHRINLIDTPGHVDFTFEVVRAIRVLDGAVVILDAVAGVETQTEKVWRQANDMKIPRIAFINKMDREGAGFSRTVKEMVAKLGAKVALINIPYMVDYQFAGVIDVVNLNLMTWKEGTDGSDYNVAKLNQLDNEDSYNEAIKAQAALVETLAELDDELVEKFLEVEDPLKLTSDDIIKSLHRCTVQNKVVPVLCGASFKNIGVQPLMDSIVDILPSPLERPLPVLKSQDGKSILLDMKDKSMCALAFKVTYDLKRSRVLVYVRVYSGKMKRGSTAIDSRTGSLEYISTLYRAHGGTLVEVAEISAGDIGVILGTRNVATGDTLISRINGSQIEQLLSNTGSKKKKQKGNVKANLDPIEVPTPVFFASVEPAKVSDKQAVEEALKILLLEDPSLHLSYDEDSEQTLLSGMGQLHLQIARDRLLNDLKANANVGKVQVSYRESISKSSQDFQGQGVSTRSTGSAPSTATVRIEPIETSEPPSPDAVALGDNNWLSIAPLTDHPNVDIEDMQQHIRAGVSASLSRGRLISLPLHSMHVIVSQAGLAEDETVADGLSLAARKAFVAAFQSIPQDKLAIMEPLMDLLVFCEDSHLGAVTTDISARRNGSIYALEDQEIDITKLRNADNIYVPPDYTLYLTNLDTQQRPNKVVKAHVPLRELASYLSVLRGITRGRGTFVMHFACFSRTLKDRQNVIIDELTTYW